MDNRSKRRLLAGNDQQPVLNERQLIYLKAIYHLDQERERYERGAWNRGQRARPAEEWRWMAYNTSESLLRYALLSAHLVDEGTGSTFEALERRRVIRCRYELDDLGVHILFVQMTPKGRKLIRTLTGDEPEQRLPAGTLREWHWKALVVAYQAGEKGVGLDVTGSGHYGGIGWQTWLRLRDYKHQGKEQPLIAEASTWVQMQRRVFTGKRPPHDYEERIVTERAYYLHITSFGRAYYAQHWQHYRQLYPEVEAPAPTLESEVQS